MTIAPYGIPVTFETFGGFYHPAGSHPQAKLVLLLSAIGYEELCTRATWSALATRIAAGGHACLRFDYPGTSDAVDIAGEPDGIADWLAAARRGIAFLRERHPGRDLVLVGQGFGATLAVQLGDATAIVLMAPVVKGRGYLRELQAWSNMLTERMGIGPDPDHPNGYAVAGLPLPDGRVAAIKAMDLTKTTQAPAPRVLLVERPQMSRDGALSAHLMSLGAEVTSIDYAGYELIMQNPSLAAPQLATLANIAAWIDELPSASVATAAALPLAPAAPIVGPHYEETPVRFGPEQRLFGVLCRPRGRASTGVMVIANSGRDYHVGWGRAAVTQARALAARGVASFRFDAGGIGDSPATAEMPAEVLYSDGHLDDIRHAIDYVDTLGLGPIAVSGRCSGAYSAFQIAVSDPRVSTVIPINIMRFVWDPRETVEQALQTAHRSIGGSLATLLSARGLKRLFSGNLRIGAAIMFVLKRVARMLTPQPATAAGDSSGLSMVDEGHRRFQILEDRGARMAMLYSEGDHALDEFRIYMGKTGARMRRYPHASTAIVPKADHDFTHTGTRAQLIALVCDVLAPPANQTLR